jgi:hypothetical protein
MRPDIDFNRTTLVLSFNLIGYLIASFWKQNDFPRVPTRLTSYLTYLATLAQVDELRGIPFSREIIAIFGLYRMTSFAGCVGKLGCGMNSVHHVTRWRLRLFSLYAVFWDIYSDGVSVSSILQRYSL